MAVSLREGRARLAFEGEPTLAEGLEGGVGQRTFEIAREALARMETVSEAAIADAMRFAKRALDLTVEGSAAVGIAWARAHRREIDGPVVVVVSGRNVDPAKLAGLLDER